MWGWFLVLLAVLTLLSAFVSGSLFLFLAIVLFVLVLGSIKIVFEYQRGVLFTLGRYSGLINPGFNIIMPLIQRLAIVDLRVDVTEVPEQSPITKDNVSIGVDAVIYFRVRKDEAQNSIIKVQDYEYAISQLAQTTMRNIIGEMTLDEVLSNREEASKKIQLIVDKASDPWGIQVDAVELKHIELPELMKTVMAKAAEAERMKRAAIIKASGEALAAEVISKAAETLSSVEGGLNLRTLQELGGIASDSSNEVVFFLPLDNLRTTEGYEHKAKAVTK